MTGNTTHDFELLCGGKERQISKWQNEGDFTWTKQAEYHILIWAYLPFCQKMPHIYSITYLPKILELL